MYMTSKHWQRMCNVSSTENGRAALFGGGNPLKIIGFITYEFLNNSISGDMHGWLFSYLANVNFVAELK